MLGWFKNRTKNTVSYGKKATNYEELKDNANKIKDMATSVLSPKKAIENAKKETFTEAKDRLGLSDIDLIRVYKNYAIMCYISLAFSGLCFLGTLYNLFISHKILAATAMMSILILCLMNAFKFSFRAFQIKHQKLVSVKIWWDRAGEWFPKI